MSPTLTAHESPHGAPLAPNDRLRRLEDSCLSWWMSPVELAALASLGEVIDVGPGQDVFAGDQGHLYVILDGVVAPVTDGTPAFWLGPGDILGEVGFVLGVERTRRMAALLAPAQLLRVPRSLLTGGPGGARAALVVRLLVALAGGLNARLAAVSDATAPAGQPEYCDSTHPAVACFAERLRGASELDTAAAVWRFVQLMPYRFGPWQVPASETLKRGYGMCTTKAILQVALLRALGMEAGFVETHVSGPLITMLLPPAYHPRFNRPTYRHYFAAARVDGRWAGFDASFTDPVLTLMSAVLPELRSMIGWDARAHGHANGTALVKRADPFAIEMRPDLDEVMSKRASYSLHNSMAMNVILDRAQGFAYAVPFYAAHAQTLLGQRRTESALEVALAGLSCDVAQLRERFLASPGPAPRTDSRSLLIAG